MSKQFNPEKYLTLNPVTGKEESQFKRIEDLPEAVRKQFKAVHSGFVRVECEDDPEKAFYMAQAENERREAVLAYKSKTEKQIARIEKEAAEQGRITGEAYEAGMGRKTRDQ